MVTSSLRAQGTGRKKAQRSRVLSDWTENVRHAWQPSCHILSNVSLKPLKKKIKKAPTVLPGFKRPALVVCDNHAQSLVYFSSTFEDEEDNGEVIHPGSFFLLVAQHG